QGNLLLPSVFHVIDFPGVNAPVLRIHVQDDGQRYRYNGSRQYDSENGEHLALVVYLVMPSEGHQVQDSRIEHKLDADQYQDRVLSGKDNIQPDTEQQRADDKE